MSDYPEVFLKVMRRYIKYRAQNFESPQRTRFLFEVDIVLSRAVLDDDELLAFRAWLEDMQLTDDKVLLRLMTKLGKQFCKHRIYPINEFERKINEEIFPDTVGQIRQLLSARDLKYFKRWSEGS